MAWKGGSTRRRATNVSTSEDAENGPGCSGFTRRAGDAASASAATASNNKLNRALDIFRRQARAGVGAKGRRRLSCKIKLQSLRCVFGRCGRGFEVADAFDYFD